MSAIASQKKVLGQYFTRENTWLYPQVEEFIKSAAPKVVVDPFAGEGHLLDVVAQRFGVKTAGLDIDPTTSWPQNDSLESVPGFEGGLVLTNPPYLSNYSAKRKGIYGDVAKYFQGSPQHDDLYRIALDKCLEKNKYVVAIVPETFINSTYAKSRAESITVVEESLFTDTETPVCIVCFGPGSVEKTKIYRSSTFVAFYQDLLKLQIHSNNLYPIRFNDPAGFIGLRAVDMPDPRKPISFLTISDLGYDIQKIKVSSRLVTFVSLPDSLTDRTESIIERSNTILSKFRKDSQDILLSPFKGNDKNGNRRRRLDYATARGILESAIQQEIHYAAQV